MIRIVDMNDRIFSVYQLAVIMSQVIKNLIWKGENEMHEYSVKNSVRTPRLNCFMRRKASLYWSTSKNLTLPKRSPLIQRIFELGCRMGKGG